MDKKLSLVSMFIRSDFNEKSFNNNKRIERIEKKLVKLKIKKTKLKSPNNKHLVFKINRFYIPSLFVNYYRL